MKQAVEGGDWSVEIDRQTRETIAATATESAPSTSSDNAASASNTAGSPGISDPVVSPFAKNVGAAVVDKTAGRSAVLLTIDAVNFALDEVRLSVQCTAAQRNASLPWAMHQGNDKSYQPSQTCHVM